VVVCEKEGVDQTPPSSAVIDSCRGAQLWGGEKVAVGGGGVHYVSQPLFQEEERKAREEVKKRRRRAWRLGGRGEGLGGRRGGDGSRGLVALRTWVMGKNSQVQRCQKVRRKGSGIGGRLARKNGASAMREKKTGGNYFSMVVGNGRAVQRIPYFAVWEDFFYE